RAVNALRTRYRNKHDIYEGPVSCELEGWADSDDSDDIAGLVREVPVMRTAFYRLEPEDQRILELRYVDGVEQRDLGRRLGKGESVARTQLRRARNRLWSLFDDELVRR